MNEFIEAQRVLHRAVGDVHRKVAVMAFHSFGLDIANYDELTQRITEAEVAYDEHINSNENFVTFVDVDYDGGYFSHAGRKPNYPVTIDKNSSISLIDSATPYDIFDPVKAQHEGYVATGFQEIEHSSKFIRLNLLAAGKQPHTGFVIINNDMPASLVYGADARYVKADVAQEGASVFPKIESSFGDDAIVTLSKDACIALARAVLSANATFSTFRE